jgi:hypothetical protein
MSTVKIIRKPPSSKAKAEHFPVGATVKVAVDNGGDTVLVKRNGYSLIVPRYCIEK